MGPARKTAVDYDLIRRNIIPLSLNNPKKDYDTLLESIGSARAVLIGEATHGTKEFYHERILITQRLIKEKGFTVVACEADWPDAYKVNRYVQNYKTNESRNAKEALSDFKRFPKWMWANQEVVNFVEWLRNYNDQIEAKAKSQSQSEKTKPFSEKVGFYGLDIYSLFGSINNIIQYLDKIDPKAAKQARLKSTENYTLATYFQISDTCEDEVIQVLKSIMKKTTEYPQDNRDSEEVDGLFNAEMNALVVKDAEDYYRHAMAVGPESWNRRDTHMMNALERLIKRLEGRRGGKEFKSVIWAHNRYSSEGDLYAAIKPKERLVGDAVKSILDNFHAKDLDMDVPTTLDLLPILAQASVTAASHWDGEREVKRVNPSLPQSVENAFHTVAVKSNEPNFLLLFTRISSETSVKTPTSTDLINELADSSYLLQRAIGVIYAPDTEYLSHYFRAKTSKQFDAVIHIDTTSEVKPLEEDESLELS
ncbi:hypothetical protein G9A89_005682 [Geosiphon pyriformis]|nr:hypothetical protein G9A89_005682 [Geosiphon pyriformis]